MEREYPYLGVNQLDGKNYVVLFTEPDRGVVVMNETDSTTIKFGLISSFDETRFDLLPPDQCVRLNN